METDGIHKTGAVTEIRKKRREKAKQTNPNPHLSPLTVTMP